MWAQLEIVFETKQHKIYLELVIQTDHIVPVPHIVILHPKSLNEIVT